MWFEFDDVQLTVSNLRTGTMVGRFTLDEYGRPDEIELLAWGRSEGTYIPIRKQHPLYQMLVFEVTEWARSSEDVATFLAGMAESEAEQIARQERHSIGELV